MIARILGNKNQGLSLARKYPWIANSTESR